MAIEIKEGKPNFFYEPYVDMQNRLRTKIVCICGVNGQYYAYGSAVHSFDDDYDQIAGENIALQRAHKVLEVLSKYTPKEVDEHLERTTIPQHMKLLLKSDITNLEGKLLPFRDPSQPKDEQNKEGTDLADEY